MAAVTNAIAGGTADTANGTSYVSGSFTPTAGALLVAFCQASGTVATTPTMTASANSITFTRISISATSNSSADTQYAFIANQLVPASPSAMTVTFSCTQDAATGNIISVAQISAMGVVGTSAVRQSAKVDNVNAGTAPSTVFSLNCLTGNPTLFAAHVNVATGSTQPTGWTEQVDATYGTPTKGGGYDSRDSGFTGTTITLGSTTNGTCSAIALELDATTQPSGTLAVTIADATLVASGGETESGTLAVTLAGATLVAAGDVTSSNVTGTLAVTLAGATLAATATETISGTLAATMVGATLAASGGETESGTLAVTLAGATLAATGGETIAGTLAATLAGATLAAIGTETTTGTLTVTLVGATLVASGTETVPGTLTATLVGASLSASGTVAIQGTLVVTLAGAHLAARGWAGFPRDLTLTGRALDPRVTGARLEPVLSGKALNPRVTGRQEP